MQMCLRLILDLVSSDDKLKQYFSKEIKVAVAFVDLLHWMVSTQNSKEMLDSIQVLLKILVYVVSVKTENTTNLCQLIASTCIPALLTK